MANLRGVSFYIVTFFIPILFFVLLEVGLRIFSYGYDFTQWVSPAKGVLMLNTDIAHKYFYNVQNVPYSDVDIFDKAKSPNAFRVFVLGESAAAGYPYLPNGSFSRYLRQRLSLEYPDSKIEVVNCAMTAINSYAMRDMMPGILKEKPDLVLIYAGNNEYYGALGVGSMESYGTSRAMVNFVIYLEQFRTFQLLRNVVEGIIGILGRKTHPTGTLMARMARDQYIGLDSKVYWEGIRQFQGNMMDILKMAKKDRVPVILGTLACNLKDQYPFVSINQKRFPPADSVFARAQNALRENEFHTADSLFRFAKDLDALRFRAPSDLNNVIDTLGREFNYPVVNVDSAFDALSPDQIVGNNLMTDHLHPTLQGYEIIGRLYYDEMERARLLPKTKPLDLTNHQQDSVTVADFPFSGLDSVIADYRVKVLKDDWPYVDDAKIIPIYRLLSPQNYIDSLAYDLVLDKLNWLSVQKDVAEWYADRGETGSFIRVMNVLISQYPISTEYYDYTASVLIHDKEYDTAYYYLTRRDKIQRSAFAEKWLGNIDLFRNHPDSARVHLLASLKLNDDDPQVWYNLAGTYIYEKDYQKALDAINTALSLDPDFPGASALKKKLLLSAK